MPPSSLPTRNRSIKPVAAGIGVGMLVLWWFDVVFSSGLDQVSSGWFGDLSGWVALAAAVLLLAVGPMAQSRLALEIGLMLAAGVWSGRAVYFAFAGLLDTIFFWLAVAWVIVIVGTWLHDSMWVRLGRVSDEW